MISLLQGRHSTDTYGKHSILNFHIGTENGFYLQVIKTWLSFGLRIYLDKYQSLKCNDAKMPCTSVNAKDLQCLISHILLCG